MIILEEVVCKYPLSPGSDCSSILILSWVTISQQALKSKELMMGRFEAEGTKGTKMYS